MFKLDLIILSIVMGALFIRQVMIFREYNKINYAPIILSIGVMGSLLHFIMHPQMSDLIVLLRESFLPMVVAIFFYIILNILDQIEKADTTHQIYSRVSDQLEEMKNSIAVVENRVILFSQTEQKAQNEVIEKLKIDIDTLKSMEDNQIKFLKKFDELAVLYEDVSHSFRNFTEIEMPELDSIVHKHIDILRISNQDHFNHLKSDIGKILGNRQELMEESQKLKRNLLSMTDISNEIATSINKSITQQLKDFTKPLEVKTQALKLSSEAILNDLNRSEEKFHKIEHYSEMIHKEINIFFLEMQEVEKYKNNILDLFTISKTLIADMEMIKTDYKKSQIKLEMIAGDIKLSESQQIDAFKKQIESLDEVLHTKTEDEKITKNIELLSRQNKIKNGYIVDE